MVFHLLFQFDTILIDIPLYQQVVPFINEKKMTRIKKVSSQWYLLIGRVKKKNEKLYHVTVILVKEDDVILTFLGGNDNCGSNVADGVDDGLLLLIPIEFPALIEYS
jgi:hypothetical protein